MQQYLADMAQYHSQREPRQESYPTRLHDRWSRNFGGIFTYIEILPVYELATSPTQGQAMSLLDASLGRCLFAAHEHQ
ncbi:MAG: hypothetical protein R3B96_11380 [Pirellulaceae bacterium]